MQTKIQMKVTSATQTEVNSNIKLAPLETKEPQALKVVSGSYLSLTGKGLENYKPGQIVTLTIE